MKSEIVAQDAVRWMVVQSPKGMGGHYRAYIGVPIDSPAAGKQYMDVYDEAYKNVIEKAIPSMNGVHGGWTFSEAGGFDCFAKGWWWYGWDYAHAGDYVAFGIKGYGNRKWTREEVMAHIHEVLPQFIAWAKEA